MTKPDLRQGNRRDLERLATIVLPPLMIIVPFISFVRYQAYDFFAPEISLAVAGLGVVGFLLDRLAAGHTWTKVLLAALLLTLFVDFQFDFLEWWGIRVIALFFGTLIAAWILRQQVARILSTVFGTLFISTLALGDTTFDAAPIFETHAVPADPAKTRDLPPVIHLIFDEFMGVEGIPADVEGGVETREILRSYFSRNGFLVFAKAYSEHFQTRFSVSHLVNFSPGTFRKDLVGAGSGVYKWDLTRNEYFARLSEMGYRISVSQLAYLDFCHDPNVSIVRCETFPSRRTIIPLQDMDVSVFDKMRGIASVYLDLSFFYTEISSFYNAVALAASDKGWEIPVWDWERPINMPAALTQIDRLAGQLERAAAGDFIFAHLAIPHHPYRYGADCRLTPMGQWLEFAGAAPRPALNTAASRALRYTLYLGQLQCAIRQMDRLLGVLKASGVFDQAIIIVQGDHGSKISIYEPKESNADVLSERDYVDAYSTLFAVKGPGVPTGYDLRLRSIQMLMSDIFSGQPRGQEEGDKALPDAPVFVRVSAGIVRPHRMPEFGDEGQPMASNVPAFLNLNRGFQ